MNKCVFFLIFILALVSCSTSQNKNELLTHFSTKKECIYPNEFIESKTLLESGIRSKVKFLGEPENLTSILGKMSEHKIPALSLAIIKEGRIEWADIYQSKSFSKQLPLKCTSLFQAASLSKPVTFLAAVRMRSAGKIDFDTNIQHYLKRFELPLGKQTVENPVTFRTIFSHTSGITSGGYEGYIQGQKLPSDLDIVKGGPGVNSPPIAVVTPPNENLAYSGGAYTLAELALQDIFKSEFSVIMRGWILDPIGMDHSDFSQPLPSSKYAQVAKGHKSSGEVLDGGWRNYPEQAAAGLWSNSVDMAKFLIEIYKAYQGKSSLFSQSDIKELISHQRDGHVYGFRVEQHGDDISITHYGGTAGYRSGMTISLASGNGLVYLMNSDNGEALGDELLLTASQIYSWQSFQQMSAYRKHIDAQILRGLTGKYKWNKQIELSIGFDEDVKQISLFFPNGDEYKLDPIIGDELEFIHQDTGVKVSFMINDGIQSFSLQGFLATRLESNKPIQSTPKAPTN